MRIGTLARRLGTTPETIRFYERRALLPAPPRSANGYRAYGERDAERLRLLIGLRSLDIPLEQAAALASSCTAGECERVSAELRGLLDTKRGEVAHRIDELRYLDERLAHLSGRLEAGASPRDTIDRKEDRDAL